MRKPILRGYYGSIFFEFLLQDRVADAIILLPSFPSGNDFSDLMDLFYEMGYHVFIPRYRGTYQSSGVFLSKNPVNDLVEFMKHLDTGKAKSLWDMKTYSFRTYKKLLITWGFGAPIAFGLAAKSNALNHIIVQAPIWDFKRYNEDNDSQDLQKMSDFVSRAYKNCYRFKFNDIIKKLTRFEELSPEYYTNRLIINKTPILVMHDPNDKFVSFKQTKERLGKIPKLTYIEHYLGHKLNRSMLSAFWKEIDKFIKLNYI